MRNFLYKSVYVRIHHWLLYNKEEFSYQGVFFPTQAMPQVF